MQAFDDCIYPLDQVTDDLQLLELACGPTWLVPIVRCSERRNANG